MLHVRDKIYALFIEYMINILFNRQKVFACIVIQTHIVHGQLFMWKNIFGKKKIFLFNARAFQCKKKKNIS